MRNCVKALEVICDYAFVVVRVQDGEGLIDTTIGRYHVGGARQAFVKSTSLYKQRNSQGLGSWKLIYHRAFTRYPWRNDRAIV